MTTNPNVRMSDQFVPIGSVDPDANAAAAYSTAWVSMGVWEQVMAYIMAGVLGTSATLDAKLEQATDSSGTGVKDITGKAITQLVKASNDDDQAVINCRSEELDVAGGFDHVRLTITVGTATSDCSAALFGAAARYAVGADEASVVEIV